MIKLNGYFIATCYDGDKIYDWLKYGKSKDKLPLNGHVLDENDQKNKQVWYIDETRGLKLDRETLPDTIEAGFGNKINVILCR